MQKQLRKFWKVAKIINVEKTLLFLSFNWVTSFVLALKKAINTMIKKYWRSFPINSRVKSTKKLQKPLLIY